MASQQQHDKRRQTPDSELRRPDSRHRTQEGFTFFELLIAMVIFVVAVASLVAAQQGCLTLAEGARNLTAAMNGVREKTERTV